MEFPKDLKIKQIDSMMHFSNEEYNKKRCGNTIQNQRDDKEKRNSQYKQDCKFYGKAILKKY